MGITSFGPVLDDFPGPAPIFEGIPDLIPADQAQNEDAIKQPDGLHLYGTGITANNEHVNQGGKYDDQGKNAVHDLPGLVAETYLSAKDR